MASYEYRCTQCSRMCESLGKYNRHLKTHSKPYQCQLCPRGFALQTDLNRHVKARHMIGQVRHACRIDACTFSSKRKDNLLHHMKKNHGQDQCSGLSNDSHVHYKTDPTESDHSPGNEFSRSNSTSFTPQEPLWTKAMFLQAATAGNISVLDACITSDMDVNIVADDKSSALHCAARSGHTPAVQYLLNTGADIEARNEKDRTPLHEAIISRIPDTVNLLIQSGAQLDSSKVTVDILGQSGSQEILKLCLSHLGESIPRDMMYKILCAASRDGQILTVAAILSLFQYHVNDVETSDGANEHASWETRSRRPDISGPPESTDVPQYTPLRFAAAEGHLEIVQLLVNHQASINPIYGKKTPLHMAVRAGHTNVVEFMLSLPNLEVDYRGHSWHTPLHYAAQSGSVEMVKLFLKRSGIDISPRNYDKITPLHLAASSGYVEVVQLLLEQAGIDINPRDRYKRTPLHLAASSGHVEVVQLLLDQAGIDINPRDSDQGTPLHLAASSGRVEVVKFLLKQAGIDIDPRNSDQRTLLHLAASSGRVEVVKFLLEQAGIDINPRDRYKRTPLHLAASSGHVEVVKLLLDQAGININPRDSSQSAPLHLAASSGHVEVVELLLEQAGIDITPHDSSQRTPLHLAASSGRVEVVRLLLEQAGIDINPCNSNKRTPLHLAASSGRVEVVTLLLQRDGVDTRCYDSGQLSALQMAGLHGHYSVAQVLLDHEEMLEINDMTIPPLAREYLPPCEVMERLLRHSDFRDVNLLDTAMYEEYGFLHTAVRKGECDVIRVLLNHKDIDVNLISGGNWKETPLSLATKLGQPHAVKLLLQHQNIDINLRGSILCIDFVNRDLTPLQIAKEKGFSEIVDLLVAKGAED